MIDEIEFIKSQISAMPMKRGRRRYSEGVKTAIRKLRDEGVDLHSISEQTGIHISTLEYWFESPKPKRRFREIKIKPLVETISSVEVHLASGSKISGVSFSDLVQLLKQGLIR